MASSTTTTTSSSSTPSIRMVIQRYRQAKLLINETDIVTVGNISPGGLLFGKDDDKEDTSSSKEMLSAGLLAYISFANTATEKTVDQAVRTLLNLSVLTLGAWGDGSSPKSILELAKEEIASSGNESNNEAQQKKKQLSIVLVPQANVIAKIKKTGKSIQYHNQIDKVIGSQLYDYFVQLLKTTLISELKEDNNNKQQSNTNSTTTDPSISPNEMFLPENYTNAMGMKYTTFDNDGFPLTLQNGETITKSGRKKLQKLLNTQSKRHQKWIDAGKPTTTNDNTASKDDDKDSNNNNSDEKKSDKFLEEGVVQVVAGSFGKRQGLELYSDMGPFCHVVELT